MGANIYSALRPRPCVGGLRQKRRAARIGVPLPAYPWRLGKHCNQGADRSSPNPLERMAGPGAANCLSPAFRSLRWAIQISFLFLLLKQLEDAARLRLIGHGLQKALIMFDILKMDEPLHSSLSRFLVPTVSPSLSGLSIVKCGHPVPLALGRTCAEAPPLGDRRGPRAKARGVQVGTTLWSVYQRPTTRLAFDGFHSLCRDRVVIGRTDRCLPSRCHALGRAVTGRIISAHRPEAPPQSTPASVLAEAST